MTIPDGLQKFRREVWQPVIRYSFAGESETAEETRLDKTPLCFTQTFSALSARGEGHRAARESRRGDRSERRRHREGKEGGGGERGGAREKKYREIYRHIFIFNILDFNILYIICIFI